MDYMSRFPNTTLWILNLMPVGHLYVFFGKLSIQVLCPFWNQVIFLLSFSSLYCLYINPLSDTWFADVLSPSVGRLFTPLIFPSDAQKLLGLMESHLPSFTFGACTFGSISKKITVRCGVMKLSPCFLLQASYLRFRSLIHFELLYLM